MRTGFDVPAEVSAITLVGSATITDAYTPVSAPNVLYLFGRRVGAGGSSSLARMTFPAVRGDAHVVSMLVNGDGSAYPNVPMHIRAIGGSVREEWVLSTPLGSGWQPWEPGSIVPDADTVVIEWEVPLPSFHPGFGTGGFWLIDDAEVRHVGSVSKYAAHAALIETIKTLNGAAGRFTTDLGGRVYTRLFTPIELADVKLPFCVVPLSGEGEVFEFVGPTGNAKWSIVGHAFFADRRDDPHEALEATVSVGRFRDDLVRALMLDEQLGGAVTSANVVALESEAGVEDSYAEVTFQVALEQYFGASDLEAP